ncbi:MAG: M14 family zinc carboxypeptidase [Candidatus Kapabacteria bacterium]|nr:M14 family zinc carboxypeptidase [Candidatus Kapabacteria bacterium]MDW8011478.1 M14 family zinc carboxypeptidase [Bacteroidota bacterium]
MSSSPQAVTRPDTLGFSIEGRPILGYRFSLGTAIDTLPAVLYTALHHAREPGSVTTLVFFLWWLLESARAGVPEALYLLRHRLLYVVPVVNPDGYAYNQLRSPNGGGMWRKNRRPNEDGSFGVDLNRNYGPHAFWNAPNGGSSTIPRSDTYRGTAPFSEPETQAIKSLWQRYRFRIALNYHTYGNLLIYPHSALDRETPDSLLYRLLCAEATRSSLYSLGRDIQTVGYAARGVSDDWMYDTSEGKARTIAMTPEVGTLFDGFWPPPERILSQARENLWLNLQAAWSAGANVRPIASWISWDTIPKLVVQYCNIGTQPSPPTPVSLRITNSEPNVALRDSLQLVTPLRPAECQRLQWELPFPAWRNGDSLAVELLAVQDGIPRRDTLRFQWGRPTVIELFTTAQDSSRWALKGWHVAWDSSFGGWALHSRLGASYPDSASLYATLRTPITLPPQSSAVLELWARWSIESNYDVAVVEVSTDGGHTWTQLRADRMRAGTNVPGSRQQGIRWGWDGNFPLWFPQRCDLTPFAGRTLLLRFGMLSDPALRFTGLSVGSIRLLVFHDSVQAMPPEPMRAWFFPALLRPGERLYCHLPPLGPSASVELFTSTGAKVGSYPIFVSSDGVGALLLPSSLAPGVYVLRLQQRERCWFARCVVLP